MLIHGREQKGLGQYGTAVLGEYVDAHLTISTINDTNGQWDISPGMNKPGVRSFSTSAAHRSTPSQLERARNYAPPSSRAGQLNQGIIPLLCISVHERSWMNDHGIWGKEEYLKRFWSVLNWKKVSETREYWANAHISR